MAPHRVFTTGVANPWRATHATPHASSGTETGRRPVVPKPILSPSRRHRTQKKLVGATAVTSYKHTKDFLLSHGLLGREVIDAPTTFHLRNYAIKHGLDLAPLEAQLREEQKLVNDASAKAMSAAAVSKIASREAETAAAAAIAADAAARASQAEDEVDEDEVEYVHAGDASPSDDGSLTLSKRHPSPGRRSVLAQTTARKAAEEAAARRYAADEAAEASRVAGEARRSAIQQLEATAQTLRRERAALLLQACTRRFLQQIVFREAWDSVVTLQKLHRGQIIRSAYRQLEQHIAVLKAGAIFHHINTGGADASHESYVWLASDLRSVCWCNSSESSTGAGGQYAASDALAQLTGELRLEDVRMPALCPPQRPTPNVSSLACNGGRRICFASLHGCYPGCYTLPIQAHELCTHQHTPTASFSDAIQCPPVLCQGVQIVEGAHTVAFEPFEREKDVGRSRPHSAIEITRADLPDLDGRARTVSTVAATSRSRASSRTTPGSLTQALGRQRSSSESLQGDTSRQQGASFARGASFVASLLLRGSSSSSSGSGDRQMARGSACPSGADLPEGPTKVPTLFKERHCMSVICNQGEICLDLIAASTRVRDDWVWALRMLLAHWTMTSSLERVSAQRKMMGELG